MTNPSWNKSMGKNSQIPLFFEIISEKPLYEKYLAIYTFIKLEFKKIKFHKKWFYKELEFNTLEYHVKTLTAHTYTATIVDLSPTIALLSISFNFLFFQLLSKFYTHQPQLLTYLPQLHSVQSLLIFYFFNFYLNFFFLIGFQFCFSLLTYLPQLSGSRGMGIFLILGFHKLQFYVKLEFLKSDILLNIFLNNNKILKILKKGGIWLFLPQSMSIRIFFLKLLLKEWSLLMHSKWLFLLKAATLIKRIQKLSEI